MTARGLFWMLLLAGGFAWSAAGTGFAQTDTSGVGNTAAADSEARGAADSPSAPGGPPATAQESGSSASPAAAANETAASQEVPLTGLVASLTIFVLAIFVGFEVITKVPPTLHTPLMSGSNAISGITIVGAIMVAGSQGPWWIALLGMLAVALAAVNVLGGFLVTHRMLSMFQRKKK